jgi:hypothetical protein
MFDQDAGIPGHSVVTRERLSTKNYHAVKFGLFARVEIGLDAPTQLNGITFEHESGGKRDPWANLDTDISRFAIGIF